MCQACDHPQRQALERDLRAGLPPAPTAKKYGLRHHASVIQHERLHMIDRHGILGGVEHEPEVKTLNAAITRVEAPDKPAVFELLDNELIVVPHDPLRRVQYHLRQAAEAWAAVDHEQRTWERLQLMVDEVFPAEGL